MTTPSETVFRPATAADADGADSLERDANLVALAHVFPDIPVPRRRRARPLASDCWRTPR